MGVILLEAGDGAPSAHAAQNSSVDGISQQESAAGTVGKHFAVSEVSSVDCLWEGLLSPAIGKR